MVATGSAIDGQHGLPTHGHLLGDGGLRQQAPSPCNREGAGVRCSTVRVMRCGRKGRGAVRA
jgi:hypothetical protein